MPDSHWGAGFAAGAAVGGALGLAAAAVAWRRPAAWWAVPSASAPSTPDSTGSAPAAGSNPQLQLGCSPAASSRAGAGSSGSVTNGGVGSGGAAAAPLSGQALAGDDILAEQFTRNVQFFGAEAQARVADAFVVVVGLGGVGSHAAHLLLRSGVGRLRLIDFDQVTLSSLNRHAVATRADVGLPKATVLARHFADIVPEARVEAVVSMYTAAAEEALLAGRPDFVIDAIDNIDTKVDLLAACRRRGIPVLCCAGAGAKADPTRLRIVDLAESSADPLARAVRHRLRHAHGITAGLPVLLSTEKPRCALLPVEQLGSNPLEYQIVPNFRVRTIPVLGTTPAIFGMAAAAHVLTQLAGQPFQPEPMFTLQAGTYATQLARLREREELRFGTAAGVAVDVDDVVYLVRELWRGLSARDSPSATKGLNRSTAQLALTRWDAAQPATVDNLVLLSFDEAEAHEAADLAAVRVAEPEWAARVEVALRRARLDHGG